MIRPRLLPGRPPTVVRGPWSCCGCGNVDACVRVCVYACMRMSWRPGVLTTSVPSILHVHYHRHLRHAQPHFLWRARPHRRPLLVPADRTYRWRDMRWRCSRLSRRLRMEIVGPTDPATASPRSRKARKYI